MAALRTAFLALVVLSAIVTAPVRAVAHGDPVDPPDLGPIHAPDELGPFEVGRTTLEIVDPDRDDRTLTVDVWYPVDPEAAAGAPPSVYDLIFAGLPSEVALDGPAVSAAGPFPLVVFSHGNNGIRFQSFFLTERVASHGFVVAAPDHAGNTAIDLIFQTQPFRIRDRPLDVSLVITRMLEKNADAADPFFATLDGERIGVMGHSFGGFTTMAMATGFRVVPPDPRVRVLVPISPAVGGLTDEELATVDLRMLVLGGTKDITVPIEPSNVRTFELATSRPRYRVDVRDAGHNSFTNICDFFTVLSGAGLPPDLLSFLLGSADEGCGPDLIPIEEAQRVTSLYAIAFLHRYLVPDPRYKPYLTAGFASTEPVDFFFATGPGPGIPAKACGLGPGLALLLPGLWWLRCPGARPGGSMRR